VWRWRRRGVSISKERYIPGQQLRAVMSLKERFDSLNQFVRSKNAWIISVAGDPEVRLETLEESTVAAELAALGYRLTQIDGGERKIPGQMIERLTGNGDGELVLATPESTAAIVETRTHAGLTGAAVQL
jgi:hypothetical protein